MGEDRLFSNRDHLKVFGVVVDCAIGITVMLRLQLLEVAAQSVLPSVVERAERPVCGAVVGRGAGDGRGDGRGGSADGVTCHAARGCYGLDPSTVTARCRNRQAKATKCSPATVSGSRS